MPDSHESEPQRRSCTEKEGHWCSAVQTDWGRHLKRFTMRDLLDNTAFELKPPLPAPNKPTLEEQKDAQAPLPPPPAQQPTHTRRQVRLSVSSTSPQQPHDAC
jgi:hypothetical protein